MIPDFFERNIRDTTYTLLIQQPFITRTFVNFNLSSHDMQQKLSRPSLSTISKVFYWFIFTFYFVETDNLYWQGWHWQDGNFLRDCNQDGRA